LIILGQGFARGVRDDCITPGSWYNPVTQNFPNPRMKITCSVGRWFLVIPVLLLNPLWGQVVLSPVAVTTDLTTYDDDPRFWVTNLINQTGITTPFVSGVTEFNPYFANPNQTFATSGDQGTNNWQSKIVFDMGFQGYLDFDLGAVYQVDKVALWNRSVSNLTVSIRETLNGPAQEVGNFSIINRQNFPFSYGADVLALTATNQGRYVRLTINGIYPAFVSPGLTFGYIAMGEVVVSALAAGAPARPTLSITAIENGDLRIIFTGALQSATNVNGVYAPVPGNPVSPFIIPKVAQQPKYFYRAVN
jgi:hypothetical protein